MIRSEMRANQKIREGSRAYQDCMSPRMIKPCFSIHLRVTQEEHLFPLTVEKLYEEPFNWKPEEGTLVPELAVQEDAQLLLH